MRDTNYAYCVARVRAAESKMLSQDDFSRLKGFKNTLEAIRFLKEKGWTSSDKDSIREVISFEKENLWRLLNESVPDKNELGVLCTLNDFFNIKAAVKCLLTDTTFENYIMMPTTLDVALLKDNLLKRDFYAAFKDKGETAEKAYNTAVKSESGQSTEIIIDRAAIDYMARYGENIDDKVTSKVCSFISDTSNIKIALRCVLTGKDESFINEAIGLCRSLSREKLVASAIKGKDELYAYLDTTAYKDGAKLFEKSFSDFEKWCDERLIEIASESRYTSFSFSPVCCYYYKKLTEIKNVNMILNIISAFSESVERQGEADV